MPATIKIILVDDHVAVREGYKLLLGQFNIEVIAETDDGRAALSDYKKLNPDLVLMDLSLNGMNGLECTRRLLKVYPTAKVIIFSMHDSVNFVSRAIEHGAMGYVLKSDPSATLVTAINQVYYQSKRYLSDDVAIMLAMHSIKAYKDKMASLNAQEHTVFLLLVEKKTRTEMAEIMSLSASTISNYKSNIMSKLNCETVDELISLAVEHKSLKQNQLLH